jgi:hypothetical protein
MNGTTPPHPHAPSGHAEGQLYLYYAKNIAMKGVYCSLQFSVFVSEVKCVFFELGSAFKNGIGLDFWPHNANITVLR